ncbi:MAG TPA: hypothetical protein DCZ91_08945 [Lachnospiraceae bacterium]|nr:hypothetical protein [Lachnospiraceae bacterium]
MGACYSRCPSSYKGYHKALESSRDFLLDRLFQNAVRAKNEINYRRVKLKQNTVKLKPNNKHER